jgi:LEA14-like dessication related protein
MLRAAIVAVAFALVPCGCAILHPPDPPKVTLAGVEPAAGEGLEMRMQLKLRIQNPNDAPIDYNGIYVQLDVQGKTLASGVSNQSGVIPAFGEAVIAVPIAVSMMGIVRQAMGLMGGNALDKLTYQMSGKLNTPSSGALRFKSQGELNLSDLTRGGT